MKKKLSAWSTYRDKDMEMWLWVTYLSGAFWIPGWLVMLPVGIGIYTWLALLACWNFIEMLGGEGDFGEWFMGPFLRGWISGPFIFGTSFVFSIIPILGAGTSFLFGWWANLDYYSYNYELFEGPTFKGPKKKDMKKGKMDKMMDGYGKGTGDKNKKDDEKFF